MEKYMSFVFDDGPCDPMREIVDLLAGFGFSGGFAVIGQKINDETEKLLKYAIDNGFSLASHSATHPHLEELGRETIVRELSEPIFEIERRIGYKVVMARLPYISFNDTVLDVTKELGLTLLGQGIDGGRDWAVDADPEIIANAVLSSASDGAIGCLHVRHGTLNALKIIVPELMARGYKLLTPDELFNVKGIKPFPIGLNVDNVNDFA